ncbi:MAG: hypothetical protein HOW73_20040 [Polyangiaceae bacterium]|nr:hypothetical protein [Polyangiaceae bacterium]
MRRWSLLALVVVLGACDEGGESTGGGGSGGSGGDAATTGGGDEGGGTTNPQGETITLTLESFDVEPGTERQVCKTINLPAGADVNIVQMRSEMQGTSHHFNVYKVLEGDVTAPVTAEESTVHDCSPAAEQLNGTAAYIFGSASPERIVDMPEGIGFHLLDGQRIILEQHVINATPDVIQGGATFDLGVAADDAMIEHHADIMWLANWSIFLPAAQETTITEHCTVPYDVEVFGLMSHTHALGTHFSIEKWTDVESTHLYDSTDWAHPVYMELGPALSLSTGEGFEWSCTYTNTTDHNVMAGQNSTDEMCMMFAYAYPKDSLSADPIQCNKPL